MHASGFTRAQFLRMACTVQGGVLLLALIAIGLQKLPLRNFLFWDTFAVLWGLAAVGPMLLVYFFSPGLRRIATEALGNSLRQLRWFELIGLATLAGVGEELLFRGVLYRWLAQWHELGAVVLTNLAFGALHALSLNYFLTATAIGFAMHLLANVTGERNLLAPMIAHGVYDWIAFLLLIRENRETARQDERSHTPDQQPVID